MAVIPIARALLNLLYENGARPAEAGEFTKRAFLNGRIDLSQAEAVMDIIQARTERVSKVAIKQLEGDVSQRLQPDKGEHNSAPFRN